MGDSVEGDSPDEIVDSMMSGSKFGERDPMAFRKGVCERIYQFDGSLVRIGTERNFIEDLVKKGHLIEEVDS